MTTGVEAGFNATLRLWTRRELSRRLLPLTALGVLAGLAAAVSLAALAGARQSDSAYDRLRATTRAPDAVVFASQVDIYAPDWSAVAALPYVEAAGSFGLPFVSVVDGPDGVDLTKVGMFSVASGGWRTDLDQPVVLEGRLPDPDDPHEVLAPPEARDAGMAVGQEYVIGLPSADQIAEFDFFGPPEGERVTVEVVGIGRSTFELAVIPTSGDEEGGGFVTTPAFHQAYAADVTYIDNLLVRFRPGEGSIEQLERDARRILGSPNLPVLDVDAVSKRVTNGTALEATGLALFGLAVALAGAVLVGQALTRSVRATSRDITSLRALGVSRRQAAAVMASPHAWVLLVTAVVALVGAVVLSPRFPIGLSRRTDPDVGLHVDPAVLIPGVILVLSTLSVVVGVTAWREVGRGGRSAAARRSWLVERLQVAGAPPTVTTGAGLALEQGRDRRALPTRPALAGVVVGVLGVVGAQTLAAGMDDAIGDPARFGSTWDVETYVMDAAGYASFDATMDEVDRLSIVVASAEVGRALVVWDEVTQPTYAISPRKGQLDFATLEGRRPASPGEVALGPDTADSYGVGIGDTIPARLPSGETRGLLVVGIALFPTTPHSSYDQGVWVTPDELVTLAGVPPGELPVGAEPGSTAPIDPVHLAQVGGDPSDAIEAIAAAVTDPLHEATPTTQPIDAANLRNVRPLPMLFAGFTTLLALGTVAHVCTSVVRRRGTDLAVLRSMGMTPRGTRIAVAWQATTLSVLGVVIGLPLGVVLGRTIWRLVAVSTPMLYEAPMALLTVLLALPVTLLGANLLATWPGRRVARLRPSELLRTE